MNDLVLSKMFAKALGCKIEVIVSDVDAFIFPFKCHGMRLSM